MHNYWPLDSDRQNTDETTVINKLIQYAIRPTNIEQRAVRALKLEKCSTAWLYLHQYQRDGLLNGCRQLDGVHKILGNYKDGKTPIATTPDMPLSSTTTSQRNKVREKASRLVQNYTTISGWKKSAAENRNHWKTAIMNCQGCNYPTLDTVNVLRCRHRLKLWTNESI